MPVCQQVPSLSSTTKKAFVSSRFPTLLWYLLSRTYPVYCPHKHRPYMPMTSVCSVAPSRQGMTYNAVLGSPQQMYYILQIGVIHQIHNLWQNPRTVQRQIPQMPHSNSTGYWLEHRIDCRRLPAFAAALPLLP